MGQARPGIQAQPYNKAAGTPFSQSDPAEFFMNFF